MLPEFRSANTEIGVNIGLVPKYAVGEIGRVARIVDHKTLEILGALVHNLTEELE